MPTGWYELIEKRNNYQHSARYSQQSIQWLNYMSKSENINIQHAENGGEYRINNFKVDGYDRANNTVYEFHGCFWHGHLCHLNADLKKWEKNKQREKDIKAAGYNLSQLQVVNGVKKFETME